MMTTETKSPPRIVMGSDNNNNDRVREFSFSIVLNPGEQVRFWPPLPYWVKKHVLPREDLSSSVITALRKLAEVDGIKKIGLLKHEFVIERAPAWAWDRILPQILNILRHVFDLEDPTLVDVVSELKGAHVPEAGLAEADYSEPEE